VFLYARTLTNPAALSGPALGLAPDPLVRPYVLLRRPTLITSCLAYPLFTPIPTLSALPRPPGRVQAFARPFDLPSRGSHVGHLVMRVLRQC
jgi:hypothetical protein